MLPEALPPFPSGGLNFDRRADVRYEYDDGRADRGVRADEGTTYPVHVRNISVGGLAFLTDRRIEPSTLLSLELPSKDEVGWRRLVMRVRTAEAVWPGRWMIGCVFARKLSNFELLALL
jgi:hypothetical protein